MRVAICLAGQIRTWRDSLPWWEGMFAHHADVEFDIFFHTWNDDREEIKDLIGVLEPTDHVIEESFDASALMRRPDRDYPSMDWQANQFYSVMRSAHLKRKFEIENRFEYDVCVRGRMDLAFTREPLSVLARFPLPSPRTIYTVHSYTDEHGRRVGDLFFYSGSREFDLACDFFRYADRYPGRNYGGKPPEVAFYDFLFRDNNLMETQLPAEPQLRRPRTHNRSLGRHETF